MGVRVVGVSVDPLDTLRRFRDEHGLAFPLVSDGDRAIGRAFGTLKSEAGTHERDTVLLATDGIVLLAYQRAHAKGHAAEVLAAVQRLRNEGRI